MLFANVVFGLPLDGPFDYIVPAQLSVKIKPGCRVKVDFGNRKSVGYVVGLSRNSQIKKLKPVIELIDESPVIYKRMLALTKELSLYYCSSWGQMIEACIPQAPRKGKIIDPASAIPQSPKETENNFNCLLLHCEDSVARRETYFELAKEKLKEGKKVLFIVPDMEALGYFKALIKEELRVDPGILYRGQPAEMEEWLRIRNGDFPVVLATRAGVFALLKGLGLIILEDEASIVYKQDQVPHYNAREAAVLRAKSEGALLVLGGACPSLESMRLARENKISYQFLSSKSTPPSIKIVDMRHIPFGIKKNKSIFSPQVESAISIGLKEKKKILVFLNRKGFATAATCIACGLTLKCPRCNSNLIFYFGEDALRCRHCNFRIDPPDICPKCNSGYIRYSGFGTEKIESEIYRIFPTGKDDITISTSAVFKDPDKKFNITVVLGIDNSLNQVDFRSGERAYSLLSALKSITLNELIIQSYFPDHRALDSLLKGGPGLFYTKELKERRQLKFPPYRHFIEIKVRAKKMDRAESCARDIFERLSRELEGKTAKALSVSAGIPAKLRDFYHWQVLLSCRDPKKTGGVIKKTLKNLRHSGIILTVDVDPI